MINEGRCAWCKSPSEAQIVQDCRICRLSFACNVQGGCKTATCPSCAIKHKLLKKPEPAKA